MKTGENTGKSGGEEVRRLYQFTGPIMLRERARGKVMR